VNTQIANEANAPALDDIEAQVEFFKDNSYVVLPNLLSTSEVAQLNEAIDQDREINPFMWWFQGNPRCGCNLLVTQPVFDLTYRRPPVLRLLDRLMNPDYCFEESAVQITEPSDTARPTAWHRDTPHWDEHLLKLNYPQVICYLTDVDESTHCFSVSPEPAGGEILAQSEQVEKRGTVHFYGKAGTAIFFHSATVHGLTTRKTENQRRILQIYYGHHSQPPINDASIIPPRLWRDHPDAETRRFFRKWNRLTRVMLEGFSVSLDEMKRNP
jgi:hypothetical protein